MALGIIGLFEAIEVTEDEGGDIPSDSVRRYSEKPRRLPTPVSLSVAPRRSRDRKISRLRSMMAKNKVSVDNRRPADLKANADGLMTSVNPRERPDWVRWPDTRRRYARDVRRKSRIVAEKALDIFNNSHLLRVEFGIERAQELMGICWTV